MIVRRSGILVSVAFLVVFGFLMEAGGAGDSVARATIWVAIGFASCYAVVGLLKGEPRSTDQTHRRTYRHPALVNRGVRQNPNQQTHHFLDRPQLLSDPGFAAAGSNRPLFGTSQNIRGDSVDPP